MSYLFPLSINIMLKLLWWWHWISKLTKHFYTKYFTIQIISNLQKDMGFVRGVTPKVVWMALKGHVCLKQAELYNIYGVQGWIVSLTKFLSTSNLRICLDLKQGSLQMWSREGSRGDHLGSGWAQNSVRVSFKETEKKRPRDNEKNEMWIRRQGVKWCILKPREAKDWGPPVDGSWERDRDWALPQSLPKTPTPVMPRLQSAGLQNWERCFCYFKAWFAYDIQSTLSWQPQDSSVRGRLLAVLPWEAWGVGVRAWLWSPVDSLSMRGTKISVSRWKTHQAQPWLCSALYSLHQSTSPHANASRK